MAETSILGAVLEVLTAIGQWFVTTFGTLMGIFVVEGELTVIGVLALISFAVALILLLVNWIRSLF